MAQARTKDRGRGGDRGPGPTRSGIRQKVAITLRLEAASARQLQAIAEGENRTLTNYVETVLLRDLSFRDEASRVITMLVAPGTSTRIAPEEVIRGEGESDAAYDKRRALVADLWSIPDNG